MTRGFARLLPLVLATMASQVLLVVLSPTIVAIGDDLDATVTAVVAILSSVVITARIGDIGVDVPVVGASTEWVSWRVSEVVPAAIARAALLTERCSPRPGWPRPPCSFARPRRCAV